MFKCYIHRINGCYFFRYDINEVNNPVHHFWVYLVDIVKILLNTEKDRNGWILLDPLVQDIKNTTDFEILIPNIFHSSAKNRVEYAIVNYFEKFSLLETIRQSNNDYFRKTTVKVKIKKLGQYVLRKYLKMEAVI